MCKRCRSKEMITKTAAKERYLLNDADLKQLKFETVYFGVARKAHLYMKREVEQLTFKKYGGKQNLLVAKEKRTKRREKRRETVARKRDGEKTRQKELDNALELLGIHLHDVDQTIYESYVSGMFGEDFPLEVVVEMIQKQVRRYNCVNLF